MSADGPRALPSVDRVIAAMAAGACDGAPHALVADAARAALASLRAGALAGLPVPGLDEIAADACRTLAAMTTPSLRPVVNATGVILQTNLGRAPLSERAIAAMTAAARGYTNLELDVAGGARGSRHDHLRDLLRRTTGAEDGIVVNNNAAGVLMALAVLAADREVIVSRGQAVEIGGGFRIPDILRQAGARLVEVGTTNRTYARDHAAAIGPETAAILRVHPSNFRMTGFVAEAAATELAAVAREHGILLLDDLGSGCLVDTAQYGLAHEPTVQESLAAGADLAMFSGDKLLGGPQCGILVGRAGLLGLLRAHPLARALRVDKLTIAALEATLIAYLLGREREEIPLWRMLGLSLPSLRRRARRWAAAAGTGGSVVASQSMVGGGALPGEGVPTWCAAVECGSPDATGRALRSGPMPVITRIDAGRVLLDPRTADPRQDTIVEAAIRGLRDMTAGAGPGGHPD